VISAFRFSPETFGEPRDDDLYFSRVRKMMLKYIGTEHFGYPETESADSVMRVFINSLDLLDSLPERLPHMSAVPAAGGRIIRARGNVDVEMLQRVAVTWARVWLFVDVLPGAARIRVPQPGVDYDAERVLQTMWAPTGATCGAGAVTGRQTRPSRCSRRCGGNNALVLSRPTCRAGRGYLTHGIEDDGKLCRVANPEAPC
jgi:hypothetical protein